MALFLGAEFTQVYANSTGIRIEPSKYAVPVSHQERAEQGIPHSGKQKAVPKTPSPTSQPRYQSHPAQAAGLGNQMSAGDVLRKNRWQFVGMMVVAGVVGGLLLRFKWLRKGLRIYAAIAPH